MSASPTQVAGPFPLILWLYHVASLSDPSAQNDRGGKRTLCDPAHIPSQDRIEPSAGLTERCNQRAEREQERSVEPTGGRDLHYMSSHTAGAVRRTQNVDKLARGNASFGNNSKLSNLPRLIGTNPRYCIRCHCAASQFLFRETTHVRGSGSSWARKDLRMEVPNRLCSGIGSRYI
jgi:hypothetical protein